jgi:hypothetical protein
MAAYLLVVEGGAEWDGEGATPAEWDGENAGSGTPTAGVE